MFLKIDDTSAERMSSRRLFQVTGPATHKCLVLPDNHHFNYCLTRRLQQRNVKHAVTSLS